MKGEKNVFPITGKATDPFRPLRPPAASSRLGFGGKLCGCRGGCPLIQAVPGTSASHPAQRAMAARGARRSPCPEAAPKTRSRRGQKHRQEQAGTPLPGRARHRDAGPAGSCIAGKSSGGGKGPPHPRRDDGVSSVRGAERTHGDQPSRTRCAPQGPPGSRGSGTRSRGMARCPVRRRRSGCFHRPGRRRMVSP